MTSTTRQPLRCAGLADVAVWLSMTPAALAKAMERHPGWPTPDAEIEQARSSRPYRGWLPDRRSEWEAWKASLPGQGVGGGRPTRREERAVNEHRCPRCHAPAGFRCAKSSASVRMQRISHPHAERLALVARGNQ